MDNIFFTLGSSLERYTVHSVQSRGVNQDLQGATEKLFKRAIREGMCTQCIYLSLVGACLGYLWIKLLITIYK